MTSETEIVKKLVEALEFADKNLYEINPSNYDHDEVCYLNSKSVEVALAIMPALTEAQAWIERQEGKASELVDDSPMYPDTEEYSQFNLWAATQGGNIDQCNYEAWKSGYRCAARLERQGKCGEGWQPIETAPRNKTTVLVWNGDVHFAYFEQTEYTHFTGWFILNNGDYYEGGYGRDYKMGEDSDCPLPTHWMPLPKPPTTSQQEARGE